MTDKFESRVKQSLKKIAACDDGHKSQHISPVQAATG